MNNQTGTLAAALATGISAGVGMGVEAEPGPTLPPKSFIVISDHQPGQIVKIVFLTIAQAQLLPEIPANALQIAVAPAGGL
jgi:hypothetical protein